MSINYKYVNVQISLPVSKNSMEAKASARASFSRSGGDHPLGTSSSKEYALNSQLPSPPWLKPVLPPSYPSTLPINPYLLGEKIDLFAGCVCVCPSFCLSVSVCVHILICALKNNPKKISKRLTQARFTYAHIIGVNQALIESNQRTQCREIR